MCYVILKKINRICVFFFFFFFSVPYFPSFKNKKLIDCTYTLSRGAQYIDCNQLVDHKSCVIQKIFLDITLLSILLIYANQLFLKFKYCSAMTDDYLEACLRLATNSYSSFYATLVVTLFSASHLSKVLTIYVFNCLVL